MYRIGIDLGGTSIAAGLVDASLRIVDRCGVRTNAPRPLDGMLDDIAAMVETLLRRNRLGRGDVASVGVGVPGTANQENGHLEDANNLGFDDVPFLPALEEKLKLPARFANDANAAAWGEYRAGRYPEKSFLLMTIGTGIGGGIILNGRLWEGVNGAAAEFGHMTIRFDGVPCTCGRTGCFEAYASASALIRQARERMPDGPERLDAKAVFDGAAAGDRVCLQLVDNYTTYLAEGTANIINLFQPERLCVGGGVSRAGDALLLPLREKTARRIYTRNAGRNTVITLARLDNDAGIIGAALLESYQVIAR